MRDTSDTYQVADEIRKTGLATAVAQVGARFHEHIAGGAARPRFAGRVVKR
jgi:hypothetical protein